MRTFEHPAWIVKVVDEVIFCPLLLWLNGRAEQVSGAVTPR